jgi:hypothetical protein
VFCGFGGDDGMLTGLVLLDPGDIFLGGDGNDFVGFNTNEGTVNGGEGDDFVDANFEGSTFIGGAGNDTVGSNQGTFVE